MQIETIGDAYLVASGLVEDGPRSGRGSKLAAAAAQAGTGAGAALEEQGGPARGPLGLVDLAAVSHGMRGGGLEHPGEEGSTAVEDADGVWGQQQAAGDRQAAADAAQRAFRFAKVRRGCKGVARFLLRDSLPAASRLLPAWPSY